MEDTTPPPIPGRGGEKSADVIWGKKFETGKRKRGKLKRKGRYGERKRKNRRQKKRKWEVKRSNKCKIG